MSQRDIYLLLIGLLVGILIAFLVFVFKKLIKKPLKFSFKKDDRGIKAEITLRKSLLRDFESMHLSPDICRLSDIYVTQKLISNPVYLNTQVDLDDIPAAFLDPLSFSDIPELSENYPLPLIKLSEALSGGQKIIIKGRIGSGKTTALANLAIEILEGRCDQKILNDYLPIYLHAQDIFDMSAEHGMQTNMFSLIGQKYSKIKYSAIQRILTSYLENSRVLLLIDGLDELTPDRFTDAVKDINDFVQKYPATLIVTVSGPFYTGDLFRSGFVPLSIKPPEIADYYELVDRFINLQINTVDMQDGEIYKRWLTQQSPQLNYYSMTQTIVSSLTDKTSSADDPLDSYFLRVSDGLLTTSGMVIIAEKMANQGNSGISLTELENILKNTLQSHTGLENIRISISSLIGRLVQANVFSSHNNSRHRIPHPETLCRLLSKSKTFQPTYSWRYLSHDPVVNRITQLNPNSEYLAFWINDGDLPAFRNLLMTLDHLQHKKGPFPHMAPFAQQISTELMNNDKPLSLRYKIALILYYTQPRIFNYILTILEKSGLTENQNLLALLLNRTGADLGVPYLEQIYLSDDPSVRIQCLINLVGHPHPDTEGLIDQTMASPTGRSVAEVLALIGNHSRKQLTKYAMSENPNSRRNAVYGFRLINEPWADQELVRLNANDNKWMVRDAAAHALDKKWDPMIYSPSSRPVLSQNPIIAAFMAKTGIETPSKTFPNNLMTELMKSGNYDELLAGVAYLFSNPCSQSITLLESMTRYENPVCEIAYQALMEINFRS